MPHLTWSPNLESGLLDMDDTHKEFVQHLAHIEQQPDTSLIQAWQDMVEHTERHFEMEDQWMQESNFYATSCHMGQHRLVLKVIREAARQALESDKYALLRELVKELGLWFSQHAQTMDAALAEHLMSRARPYACGRERPVEAGPSNSGSCPHPDSALSPSPCH